MGVGGSEQAQCPVPVLSVMADNPKPAWVYVWVQSLGQDTVPTPTWRAYQVCVGSTSTQHQLRESIYFFLPPSAHTVPKRAGKGLSSGTSGVASHVPVTGTLSSAGPSYPHIPGLARLVCLAGVPPFSLLRTSASCRH